MPILVLPAVISSLRYHFPNFELQQKSNAIARVPKSMGCSNLLTTSPSLAFNTHFLAPTPLWTTFSGPSIFIGQIQWSLKGLHIRPFGQQFIKVFDLFSSIFLYLGMAPFPHVIHRIPKPSVLASSTPASKRPILTFY